MKFLPFILFIFFLSPWTPGFSHNLEKRPDLKCTKEFPCFSELRPRIQFWVDVFSKYRNDQAIFHDSELPQRVYGIVDDVQCSGRRRGDRRRVRRERSKWKVLLKDLAQKVENGTSSFSKEEVRVLSFFDEPSGDDLREASERVRCQQGNRDRFARGLSRFGIFRDFIEKELEKENLSPEIQYLPFVESAFNPQAYSRVGAAGLWQIMPRTAKRLGLKIGIHSDERLDPYQATRGAINYLTNAYKTLGKVPKPSTFSSKDDSLGPFVITSYNYGILGMRKALKRFGPDFVRVIHEYEGRRFRTAVRNFYVSFLAARHVATNASTFFPEVLLQTPPQFQTIQLPKSISAFRLQTLLKTTKSKLKHLNPALTRWVWHEGFLIPKGHHIHIPHGTNSKQLLAQIESSPKEDDPWLESVEYRVQRGDFPCGIARTFRVSCSKLMALNGIGRRGLIRVGQKLRIPPRKGAKASRHTASVSEKKATPSKNSNSERPNKTQISSTPIPIKPLKTIPPKEVFGPSMPPQKQGLETMEFEAEEFSVEKEGDRYWVRVEYEETLGHYSDWLDLGFATTLRRLNGLRYGKPIRPGQKIFLPIENESQKKDFETKRSDYHRALQAEFFSVFEVEEMETYRIRRGDTVWSISRKFQIPQWLMKKENPTKLAHELKAGDTLKIPVLKSVQPEENDSVEVVP